MVSIFSFLPELQSDKVEPEVAPRVMVGAVSPLWLMFGGAAAAGATYWWWASRWREAVNVEALMALTPEPVSPPLEVAVPPEAPPEPVVEAAIEPVVEAVALVANTAEEALDAGLETAEAVAGPVVEVAVAAHEDVAEVVVESIAHTEPAVVETVEAAAEAPAEIAEPIVETAPEVIETVVEAASEVVDDLTRLVGVGPKLAASLAELGVTRFSQIAAWTPDELSSYDQLLNLKGRAERDAWIAQAKRFAAPVEA